MKIELSFHATNLKNVAGFGKGISDPFCVVTKIPDNEGNVQQLGKTEVVKNNLNPNWAHVFILDDYDPAVETKITVSIYDKVSNNGDNISMGSTIFEIGSILKSRGGTTSKKIGKTNGMIYVHGRESQGTGVLRMKLRGTKLKNVEFGVFAKSDPFFELSRKIDSAGGQTWDNIYRSEEIKNCLEPQWQTIVLELSVLCFGLLDNPIKLEVFDYESSGKHTPMGNVITTINELQIKQSRRELLRLKQDNKDVGMIDIVSLSISNNIGNDTTEAVVTQTLQSTTISSPSSSEAAAATTTTTTAAATTAAAATVFVPTTTTTTDRDDGQQHQQLQQQASSFAVMAREFENNKPIALKNDVRMISGCEDHKTSADVSNVGSYKLPDPAGRAGGACTATLLKVLYENENHVDKTYTYVDVLSAVRQDLKSKGLSQIPQLTSSNPIDVNEEFQLVPDSATGTRRAVLVGINYVGQRGELRGCHNDVLNVYKYIQDFYGFQDDDITILMDDGKHVEPTKSNILDAYRKVVAESQNGDAIFLHYSGHGSRVRDTSGDEDDGYDECLCPLDCHSVGMIIDDQLYDILVRNLAQGVHMVALMDCCHSGTVMDLPYHWKADGTMQDGMQLDSGVDLNGMMQQFGGAALGLFAGLGKGAKRVGKGVGKGAKKVGTGVQKIVPDAIKPNAHHSTEAASTSSQPGDSGVFIPPSAPPAAAAASAAAQPGSNDGGGVFIPPSQPSAAGAQPSAPSHIYDPNNQQVPSYGNTHPATANAGVYVPSGQQQTTYIAPEKYDPYAQTTTTTTTTSAPSYGGGGGGQPYNPYGQPQQQQTYTPNSYGTTNVGGTNPAAGGGGGYVPAAQYNPYAQQQQTGTNVVGGTNPAGGGGGYVPAAQYNPYAQQQQPGSNPNSYGTGTGNQQNNNNKGNTPGQYKPYV